MMLEIIAMMLVLKTQGILILNADGVVVFFSLCYFPGLGNAAFEVADGIYGVTNLIHMVARSRVRLSWETHYVGDLRYDEKV